MSFRPKSARFPLILISTVATATIVFLRPFVIEPNSHTFGDCCLVQYLSQNLTEALQIVSHRCAAAINASASSPPERT